MKTWMIVVLLTGLGIGLLLGANIVYYGHGHNKCVDLDGARSQIDYVQHKNKKLRRQVRSLAIQLRVGKQHRQNILKHFQER